MLGGGKAESILNILGVDLTQGKLNIVKTIEQLPESIFHIEWHNSIF